MNENLLWLLQFIGAATGCSVAVSDNTRVHHKIINNLRLFYKFVCEAKVRDRFRQIQRQFHVDAWIYAPMARRCRVWVSTLNKQNRIAHIRPILFLKYEVAPKNSIAFARMGKWILEFLTAITTGSILLVTNCFISSLWAKLSSELHCIEVMSVCRHWKTP